LSAAAAQPPKTAKLWRRTRVGGSIAGALALILYLTTLFHSEVPMLALASAVLGVCIWEVHRMGSLRGRGLALPLGLAGGVAAWLVHHDFTDVGGSIDLDGHRDLGFGFGWMIEAFTVGLAAATIGQALTRSGSIVVKLAALLLAASPFFLEEWLGAQLGTPAIVVLFLFVALRLLVFGASRRGESFAVMLLGPLLAVSILGLVWVWYDYGHWGLVALIALCKVGDSAGYYVGSTIGKHHPYKRISPGKTTEGTLASLVAASLFCVLAHEFGWLPAESWFGALCAGAVANVAAQASDLLESWVKRKAGVKDSGEWFGPSGGMLDLVDSFFLATPAALGLWPLVLRL
jgi:CDP-diglyceride synthetase